MTDQVYEVSVEPASSIKESKLPEGFSISVDNWLMAEHVKWTVAAKEGDVPTLNSMMATAISQWPYKLLKPNRSEDYLRLTPKQWSKAIKAVGVEVNNAFLD